MAEFPVPLDNLIAYVKTLHPEGGPLENVTDAFRVSEELGEKADALIGHFVDQARHSGASWSQIGAAMGVTKQAAQKRFVPGRDSNLIPRNQMFSRFTQRAANVLMAAGRLADGSAGTTADGETTIGAAHLAAGVLTEPDGVGAKAIARTGRTPEQVYTALGAGPAEPVSGATSADLLELGFDETGKAALKAVVKAALSLGHNYVGTEHLLLGVVDAGGPAAGALAGLGLTAEAARQLVAAEIKEIQASRQSG